MAGNLIGTNAAGTGAIGNGSSGVNIEAGASGNIIGGTLAADRNIISGNAQNGVLINDITSTGNVIAGNYIGLGGDGDTVVGNGLNGISLLGGIGTIIGGFTATPGTGGGNVISGNAGGGVVINGSQGEFIRGNLIGTDQTGLLDRGNASYGIQISNGSPHTVGGDDSADGTLDGIVQARNVISGNDLGGIFLNSGPSNVTIQGNYIGTNLTGTGAIANGLNATHHGIAVASSYFVIIGGTTAGAGNVISGNTGIGISATQQNLANQTVTIQGNFIGTNAAGSAAIPNVVGGISVSNGLANSATIGGTSASARNIISGNTGYGISFSGATSGAVVQGNYIGTNASGTAAIGNSTGVRIDSGAHDNTIGGDVAAARNIISGNSASGIVIVGGGTDGNVFEGNYIGLNAAGTLDLGNSAHGVFIDQGAANNTVGGTNTTAVQSLIISGSTGGYILLFDAFGTGVLPIGATASQVEAELNGLSTIGGVGGSVTVTQVGNIYTIRFGGTLQYSVLPAIAFSPVGGDVSGTVDVVSQGAFLGNVISGNDQNGVYIQSQNAGEISDNNTVAGNYIGTDRTGTLAIGNTLHGVVIVAPSVATNDTIGGSASGSGNVISGNLQDGVRIDGAAFNTLAGNIVGLDVTGSTILGNGVVGIRLFNQAQSNTIGGTTPEERNVISGNGTVGIAIANSQTSQNVVIGNYIGTSITGQLARGNATHGIAINDANNNTIGGTTVAERNVISGNSSAGVFITGSGATGNTISGNYIGLSASGTVRRGNGTSGVLINSSASNNTIGGTSPGSGNVISANTVNGVLMDGASFNVVAGNIIGLDPTGTIDLGNNQDGVALNSGSTNNVIGGTVAAARNIISGNDAAGVIFRNTGTSNNSVIGNYIGTDINGTLALGNVEAGVTFNNNPSQNTVGGTTPAERNVISGNQAGGIRMQNDSTGNSIIGNYIGVAADGMTAIGSGNRGVYIFGGSSGNVIGGTAPGAGNIIAYSLNAGVAIDEGNTVNNSIRGNSIYSNGGLGIDLGDDGVTTNDATDADTGPNGLQNFPILTFVGGGASTSPKGLLNAAANATYLVDFYASDTADPSGHGEGKRYLGSATVITDALGRATISITLLSSTTSSEFVTATVTDVSGNTSEFAQSVLADIPPTVNLNAPASALLGITLPFTPILTDSVPGKTYQYSWAVTLNGTPKPLPDATVVSDTATNQETFFFTPAQTGTYMVSVTVTDSRGGVVTTISDPIVVTATTLGVTITGNPLGSPVPFAVVAGEPVTLTSRIADPRQPTIDPKTGLAVTPNYTYAWSISRNGVPFTLPVGTVTSDSTLTFSPTSDGLYLASVSVQDGTLAAGADSVSLYNTGAPSAQVIATPGTAVTAGTLVGLRAVLTDVALRRSLSYAWTITPDNGQSVIQATTATGDYSFTPTTNGNYLVSLTITDDLNRSRVGTPLQICASKAIPTVTISGAPQRRFPVQRSASQAPPAPPGTGNTYTLSWTATNTAGTVSPATTSGSTFTFTPSAAGTVVVTLTATDQYGVKTAVPVVIGVAPPAATLTVSHPAGQLQGQQLSWTANLSPAPAGTTYSWSALLPDGHYKNLQYWYQQLAHAAHSRPAGAIRSHGYSNSKRVPVHVPTAGGRHTSRRGPGPDCGLRCSESTGRASSQSLGGRYGHPDWHRN